MTWRVLGVHHKLGVMIAESMSFKSMLSDSGKGVKYWKEIMKVLDGVASSMIARSSERGPWLQKSTKFTERWAGVGTMTSTEPTGIQKPCVAGIRKEWPKGLLNIDSADGRKAVITLIGCGSSGSSMHSKSAAVRYLKPDVSLAMIEAVGIARCHKPAWETRRRVWSSA